MIDEENKDNDFKKTIIYEDLYKITELDLPAEDFLRAGYKGEIPIYASFEGFEIVEGIYKERLPENQNFGCAISEESSIFVSVEDLLEKKEIDWSLTKTRISNEGDGLFLIYNFDVYKKAQVYLYHVVNKHTLKLMSAPPDFSKILPHIKTTVYLYKKEDCWTYTIMSKNNHLITEIFYDEQTIEAISSVIADKEACEGRYNLSEDETRRLTKELEQDGLYFDHFFSNCTEVESRLLMQNKDYSLTFCFDGALLINIYNFDDFKQGEFLIDRKFGIKKLKHYKCRDELHQLRKNEIWKIWKNKSSRVEYLEPYRGQFKCLIGKENGYYCEYNKSEFICNNTPCKFPKIKLENLYIQKAYRNIFREESSQERDERYIKMAKKKFLENKEAKKKDVVQEIYTEEMKANKNPPQASYISKIITKKRLI
jgi:hypothetical protein